MTAKHTGADPAMAPPNGGSEPTGTGSGPPMPASFFAREAAVVARDLLGQYLVRRLDGKSLVARIVETEAYLGAHDRASHAWGGRRTARNAALYLPPGHAYVYFIYGMHFCLNVVANCDGGGGAVLFRAAEILVGRELVQRQRGLAARNPRAGELLGGPGRLCQGLAIDRGWDGWRLDEGDLMLVAAPQPVAQAIASGPRVGIAFAGDAAAWPLRFALAGHPEMSKPRLG